MQSTSSNNCIHHYNVEIFNLFDPELQKINLKAIIKKKLKELLRELKKFKVQKKNLKKWSGTKIFHSGTKVTASYSDIDEAFKSMHQSIMAKKKKKNMLVKIRLS